MIALAESNSQMEIHERIAQSAVRVRSGIRLIVFLVVVAGCAYFFDVMWLVKLSGSAAGLFTLITSLEYWNVHRLTPRNKDKGPGSD